MREWWIKNREAFDQPMTGEVFHVIEKSALDEALSALDQEQEMRLARTKERDELKEKYETLNKWHKAHGIHRLNKENKELKAEVERFEERENTITNDNFKLREECERLRAALKRECCCTGELNWSKDGYVLCDACEALKSLERE